ncbi:MAG: hydroxymethylbilane synthase [Candidatus Omnitrophota bacterium]
MDRVVIGTRASALAVAQAGSVQAQLRHLFPKIDFQLKWIRTQGDKTDVLPGRHAKTAGFFTKEIEEALLSKKIDIALHSLKDLPTRGPEALQVAAVLRRETPQDGLVTPGGRSLFELPPGARIGTGSARRKAQLLHFNAAFEVVGVRGNLDTRLRKLEEGAFEALVVALAGLRRLGLEDGKVWPIPYEVMLPAPGQGALALQIRRNEKALQEMVLRLNDAATERCVAAERAFLSRLGGGCQLPLGALALVQGEEMLLEGVLMSENGQKKIRTSLCGKDDPFRLGERLGEQFFNLGAATLLK